MTRWWYASEAQDFNLRFVFSDSFFFQEQILSMFSMRHFGFLLEMTS